MTEPLPEQPFWYRKLITRPEASGHVATITSTVADGEPVPIANPANYVAAALERECAEMASAPEGTRNPRLNTAAFALGRLIAGGLPLDEDVVVERLTTAADEAGLYGSEVAKTIRSGLRGGARNPLAWVPPVVPPMAVGVDLPAGLVPAQPGVVDPVELEAARQRVTRAARRLVDAEEADAAFTPPQPRSLRDFLDEPDEAAPYLVADLLPYGANATLTAQFKAGKTTMLGNLVRALVDGDPFLGRHNVVGHAGRVSMFDYEMTDTQLRRWLRESGIRNIDAVDIVPLRGRGLALDRPRGKAWATSYLRERQIGVWLVDPFARAYLGDENDNGAVTVWTDALDVIKNDAGVHTLVMAVHTGRAVQENTRARGATRLDDWPDVRWLFTKADDGTRYFAATGRDVEVEEVGLSYDGFTRRYVANLPGRRAADRSSNIDRLIEVMVPYGAGPGQSQTAISSALGRSGATTKKWLDEALSARRIRKVGDKYWSDVAVPFDQPRPPDPTQTGPGLEPGPVDPPRRGVRESGSADFEESGDGEGDA